MQITEQTLDRIAELAKLDYSDPAARAAILADMERVLRLEPRHYGAMSIAAGILRETGNRDAAFRMLEEAVKLHPHAPNGRRTLDLMRSQVEGRQT